MGRFLEHIVDFGGEQVLGGLLGLLGDIDLGVLGLCALLIVLTFVALLAEYPIDRWCYGAATVSGALLIGLITVAGEHHEPGSLRNYLVLLLVTSFIGFMLVPTLLGWIRWARWTRDRPSHLYEGFERDPRGPRTLAEDGMSNEEWIALCAYPTENLLRSLYGRYEARNRIADDVAEGPAETYEQFCAQVRKLPPLSRVARANVDEGKNGVFSI